MKFERCLRRCRGLLGSIALIAGCPVPAAAPEPPTSPVDLKIVSTSTGNLFYQLECIAQRLRCSERTYREFWNSLGFDKSDEEIVQRFADTLERYNSPAPPEERRPAAKGGSRFGPEITDLGPLPSQSFNRLSRIRIAAYSAPDAGELARALAPLLQPDDLRLIEAALGNFEPRFVRWWDGRPAASMARFAARLEALMSNELAPLLPAILDFYGFDRDRRTANVVAHLMPHPIGSGQSNGTIIENHAVIEVLKGEAPEARLGVLVHELSHYFFASAPGAWHARRLEGALHAADPRAPAALALMNEGLATAIGNGVLEERLRGENFPAAFEEEQSLYATGDVDAVAKEILPLVRAYLDDNRPMDAEFIDRYFRQVIARLGAQLDSLEARLRVSAYVAGDRQLDETMNAATRWLDTRSVWHTDGGDESLEETVLARHGYLNGVVLSTVRERHRFLPLVPIIDRLGLAPGSAAMACTTVRESGSILYVVLTDGTALSSRALVGLLEQATPCLGNPPTHSAPRPLPG